MSKGNESTLFPIGQTASMCGVSPRALRFYEKNGLIIPDRVDKDSKYRYYSYETMRRIHTIRYMIDEGFSLSTIREILKNDDPDVLKELFWEQITETEAKIRYDKQRLASLHTWFRLLEEGSRVLEDDDTSVRMRTVERRPYFLFRHHPTSLEEQTEAFIENRYLTLSMEKGTDMIDMGGDFNILYPSYKERMAGCSREIVLLQTVYPDSEPVKDTEKYGGFSAIACYHIGDTNDIVSTYDKMLKWADAHSFTLEGSSLERRVLDIYSIGSLEKHVTEVLLPLKEDRASHKRKD